MPTEVATPKNSKKTIKKNENNEKGKSRNFCGRRNGCCAPHLCVGVDMVNFNHSGRMKKKIKEDTSGLVQDMTTWVLGFLKREGRLPSHYFVKNTFVHTFGYGDSPLLEQLAKRAVDNVMSMPLYKQVKNKKNNQNNELRRQLSSWCSERSERTIQSGRT